MSTEDKSTSNSSVTSATEVDKDSPTDDTSSAATTKVTPGNKATNGGGTPASNPGLVAAGPSAGASIPSVTPGAPTAVSSPVPGSPLSGAPAAGLNPKTGLSAAAPVPSTQPGGISRVATGPATAPVGAASKAPAAVSAGRTVAGAHRVRLTMTRVDPYSVLKISFLLSVGWAIASVVATMVLWGILNAMGVFDSINKNISGAADSTFSVYNYIGFGKVLAYSIIMGFLNIAIISALSALGAYLYNMAATLVGGVEVDLAND